jgi:hypothetical protein
MGRKNYLTILEENINRINEHRSIKSSSDLNLKVKRVCIILSGSRSGSSLLKTIVSKSKDIAYLAGEEEPYFILSRNGFPFNSDSDVIKTIDNKQHLLDCIFDEMGINCDNDEIDLKQIEKDWRNRMYLQDDRVEPLLLNYSLFRAGFNHLISDGFNWNEINQITLKDYFNGDDTYGYYDIIPENTNFIKKEDLNRFKIEEPPFVIPGWKRQLVESDLETKTLFFKTPQDCYRIGLFEELFPNAEIKYIHLTRGFAQSVNGLMDGWLSETGFFAHNMEVIDERLNIEGYTDKVVGGDRWWNFDLPENWREYKDKPLEEVCLNQWYSAHNAILESEVEALTIKFEDFLEKPQETLNYITEYLNISPIKSTKLPIVMATNTPSNFRWKKREDIIMKLSKQDKVIDMMLKLNYSTNPETWI